MDKLFFVIDDSLPNHAVYRFAVGEDEAMEYYLNDWIIYEIGTVSEMTNMLNSNRSINILDIGSHSHQWEPQI